MFWGVFPQEESFFRSSQKLRMLFQGFHSPISGFVDDVFGLSSISIIVLKIRFYKTHICIFPLGSLGESGRKAGKVHYSSSFSSSFSRSFSLAFTLAKLATISSRRSHLSFFFFSCSDRVSVFLGSSLLVSMPPNSGSLIRSQNIRACLSHSFMSFMSWETAISLNQCSHSVYIS